MDIDHDRPGQGTCFAAAAEVGSAAGRLPRRDDVSARVAAQGGRARIRGGLAALLLAGASWPGHAAELKVLHVSGGEPPAALQCPTAAAGRRVVAANQDAPAPPDREEVDQMPQAEGAQQTDLSFQEAPAVFRQGGFLRIGLWGDSHAAARFFSDALVEGLGYAPEGVQPGFIPASMGVAGVRLPLRKSCVGPGWARSFAYRGGAQAGTGYGKGLVRAATEQAGSYLWLDFRTNQQPQGPRAVEIRWSAPDGRSSPRTVLAVSVNDQPEELVAIDRDSERSLQIEAEASVMTVKLRLISGQLALDGFIPRYASAPTLIMDTFGIPGATAKGWENIDVGALKDQEQARPYDVVLLEYGTNEGNDPAFSSAKYAASLRAALGNVRAVYPGAACILIGPTDRGVLVRKARGRGQRRSGVDMLSYARTHRAITEVQQRIAPEFGCLNWDWQGAMGGPGGAYRWLYRQPPWMSRDLIHLTPLGYQHSARMLADRLRGSAGVAGALPR